jgi:hypothetical protein
VVVGGDRHGINVGEFVGRPERRAASLPGRVDLRVGGERIAHHGLERASTGVVLIHPML